MKFGSHFQVLRKRQVTVGGPSDAGDDTETTSITQTSRSVPTRTSTTQTTTDTTTETSTTATSISIRTSDSESQTDTRSTRSSSSSSSTEESSSSPTSLSSRTSAVVQGSSTSTVTNIVTIGAPSTSASVAPDNHSGGSSGPSAGTVVGVVAGGLVGIVVIAGLLGYFFKTKFGKDKDDDIDDAVFNKNDFRHESIMLQDDDMDRLSMRSGSAAGSLNVAGMGRNPHAASQRNNTGALSSYERGPIYNLAPTTSPVNPHFATGAPPMPSFQPGQIVNTNYYHAPSNYASSEGGWGVAASYAPQSKEYLGVNPQQTAGLERNPSVASHYVDDYQTGNQGGYHDYPPQNGGRSGSPVDQNPQQFYQGPNGGNNRQLSVRNRGSDGNGYEAY